MSSLKDQLIKLGSQNPELQEHIRPILDKIAASPKGKAQVLIMEYLEKMTAEGNASQVEWSELASLPSFRSVTFQNIMSATEGLRKKGLITVVEKRGVGTFLSLK